jgi:hypothetical protein
VKALCAGSMEEVSCSPTAHHHVALADVNRIADGARPQAAGE